MFFDEKSTYITKQNNTTIATAIEYGIILISIWEVKVMQSMYEKSNFELWHEDEVWPVAIKKRRTTHL